MSARGGREQSEPAAVAGAAVLLAVVLLVGLGAGRVPSPLALAGAVLGVLAPVLGVCAAGGLAVAGARGVAVRRTLVTRTRLELVPSEGFEPSVEAVTRFAAQLAGTRRTVLGVLDRPASAVRVRLECGADGLVHYMLEVPARALPALEAALGAYHELDVRPADPDLGEPEGGVVVRCELVLARSQALALGEVALTPDPLQGIAAALAHLDYAAGERARIALDLQPAAAHQRVRLRRRLLAEANRQTGGLLGARAASTGRLGVGQAAGRRYQGQALDRKLGGGEALFTMQLLLRVRAASKPAALARMRALLTCFHAFAGENYLRPAGLAVGGLGFMGSDLPWRRGRFDARIRTGLFAPRKRGLVSAGEIAGLLKPPTASCVAENVARSGGVIPRPPVGLPTFEGDEDLIPLGRVEGRDGSRLVGVRVKETFFSYMAGRSRYGKTETAIGQFVHLARAGHGGLFLDPHADAIREIKTYLSDMPERLVEIDLSDPDVVSGQTWNLFWLEQRTPGEAAARVEAFVDALAAALRWDDRNTRALNIATQAAQALVELAQRMPESLAPTIFQVPTLLSDKEWRKAALPYLSTGTAGFFRDRYPRLAPDAATAVTNIIDRLRAARPVATLMGSPTSTYDARSAMQDGKIVLVCPGSGSTRDRLVANLLVYDVLHAFKQRAKIPAAERKPFWLFLDELQSYDGPNLPVLLEQSAKYGGRAFLFNQNPDRLSAETWNAVTTNRSHLSSTMVNAKAGQMIAREFSGQIEPELLTRLDRYTYLAQVTLGTQSSRPFLVHGVTARELHAKHHVEPDPVPAKDSDGSGATPKGNTATETLKRVEGHDRQIANWLKQKSTKRNSTSKPKRPASRSPAQPAGGATVLKRKRRAEHERGQEPI